MKKHNARKVQAKPQKPAERPEVIVVPAQCPQCRSTRRKPYRDGPLTTAEIPVKLSDGRVYNREVWHNAECTDCGQLYRVIEYRYVPDAIAAAVREAAPARAGLAAELQAGREAAKAMTIAPAAIMSECP